MKEDTLKECNLTADFLEWKETNYVEIPVFNTLQELKEN